MEVLGLAGIVHELLKNFDETYKKEDIDWGEPKGNKI